MIVGIVKRIIDVIKITLIKVITVPYLIRKYVNDTTTLKATQIFKGITLTATNATAVTTNANAGFNTS